MVRLALQKELEERCSSTKSDVTGYLRSHASHHFAKSFLIFSAQYLRNGLLEIHHIWTANCAWYPPTSFPKKNFFKYAGQSPRNCSTKICLLTSFICWGIWVSSSNKNTWILWKSNKNVFVHWKSRYCVYIVEMGRYEFFENQYNVSNTFLNQKSTCPKL